MALKFIRLDVDNVGDKIELALLNNDLAKANSIHSIVQQGIAELRNVLVDSLGFEILMAGCDDILFQCSSASFNIETIEKIRMDFFGQVGFSLSVGVGATLQEALLNLSRAKMDGKDKIVGK